MKKLSVALLFLMLFPVISANDVLSINAGGNEGLIINPHEYIEGFFSCVPFTCADFGYNCDSWNNGCGGIINCGTCASGYTCTNGVCTAVPVTPPGGDGGAEITQLISVIPTEFNINLAVNTNVERIIKVTNLGTSSTSVGVSQIGLGEHIILNTTSFTLASGATKDLKVVFVATSETGIFTGKIIIGGRVVSVSLNVKTKLLLFDSNIIVLNKDYLVQRGEKLRTQVTLIPMGDAERTDVTLNYVVKDYSGKTYLTKTETTMVEKQVNFNRNFDTGTLPLGKYVVGLQLVYSNGVAPSSAHFEVVKKTPINIFGKIAFFLILLILIVAILLVIVLIERQRKKRKQTMVAASQV